ncbi:hypothetical protein AAMO2058_000973300 [Amorphochlora amoebiformis]
MTSTPRASGLIRAFAVIGKENQPLYVQTYTLDSKEDRQISLHYHIHSSLDIVEEKVSAGKKAYPNARDLYLGQLFVIEQYALYGYSTNTKVKFILLIQGSAANNTVKSWLRELHDLYIHTISNPFVELIGGNGLMTSSFRASVNTRVAAFNRQK